MAVRRVVVVNETFVRESRIVVVDPRGMRAALVRSSAAAGGGTASRAGRTTARFLRKTRRAAQVVGLRPPTAFTGHGPPPGADEADLQVLCQQLTGRSLASVMYQHASGWKAGGAYRVRLRNADGGRADLICKVNHHDSDAIVALQHFPVAIGAGEPLVLGAADKGLRKFLPDLYLARQAGATDGVLYMQHLSGAWHACTSTAADLSCAARAVARLHDRLWRWYVASAPSGLIRYDDEFSYQLNTYVQQRLREYAARSGDATARDLVRRWAEITELHLATSHQKVIPSVVHGDYNTANIFVHTLSRKVKMIDWEWAGVGDGYRDLAALLKRAPRRIEARSLAAYHANAGGIPDWKRYEKHQLERGLLDAAFLSAQLGQTAHGPRMDIGGFIRSSLSRVLEAEKALKA